MACSTNATGLRWSADPAANRVSVVVSALAMIDEIETLALLIGAGPQTDDHFQHQEDDDGADARPYEREADRLRLRDHLRHHVVVGNLARRVVEHAGPAERRSSEDARAQSAED